MRPGESGPETVVREVREETGLVVEPGPISTAHALWLPGGRSGRLALRLIYPAKVAGGRLRTERNGSTDGCAFFRPEEIAGMRYLDLVDVALGLVAPGLARPQIPAIARGFFDAQGRLTGWPAPRQRTARRAIVEWIASRLPESAVMGEDELRALLEDLHTFGEPSLLRRELMDHGLLRRRGPGSSYVKV
jgi:8-oxo-dGTP pyrophosphatase MutT (NUDIX family)